jgi:hypothetical protein
MNEIVMVSLRYMVSYIMRTYKEIDVRSSIRSGTIVEISSINRFSICDKYITLLLLCNNIHYIGTIVILYHSASTSGKCFDISAIAYNMTCNCLRRTNRE